MDRAAVVGAVVVFKRAVWKVYGNEEKARCAFAKYKKCSDIYYSKWLSGTPINKLIVKAAA
ncbi:MAG: DUF3793 family protein [Ruminococcus sp.]|nr:DUF3793 family protein [Ruminococcus sp.]